MTQRTEVSSATAPVYSAGNAAENIPTIIRCDCGKNVVLWDTYNVCLCGIVFISEE